MKLLSVIGAIVALLVVASGSVMAQPSQIPRFIYRADTRAPNDVRRAGGFVARGVDASRPGTIVDLSLFSHAIGHAGPQNDRSGYVATTTDFMGAYRWLWDHGGGFRMGYVYTIRPTVNFVDVNASLGRFLEPILREEHEWAALGRIHWYQVVGWRSIAEPPDTPMTPNPQYNPNHIAFTVPVVGTLPELAHFPAAHEAWGEMPWMAFTSCGPHWMSNQKRAEKSANGPCVPFEDGAMDRNYYRGYLSSLSATACGGPCLEGERSAKQDALFYSSLTLRFDGAGLASCDQGEETIAESMAEIYKEDLCKRLNVADKLRVREGYLLKSADSSCMVVGTLDTQYTTGEICQPEIHEIFQTSNAVPGCPTGYELMTKNDLERNTSVCFTQLDLYSVARLAGQNVVSGSERLPCVVTKNTNSTESSLCKKISRTTPEVVVSSATPEGAACWGGYSQVNVKQAMANRSALCTLLIHSASDITSIGLADGWFGAITCHVWQGALSERPAYSFCNNGTAERNRFLSTMMLVRNGEVCPSGFELASEAEIRADLRICYGSLPPGSTARLANSASVRMPAFNETVRDCTTQTIDPSPLTMAVCKAVAPVH